MTTPKPTHRSHPTPRSDFHLVNGGRVFPTKVLQETDDLEQLLADAEAARPDLLEVLRSAAGKIKAGERYAAKKPSKKGGKKASLVAIQDTPRDIDPSERAAHLRQHGFILAPNKRPERIAEKLAGEKGGQADAISDYLRATLIVDSPESLDRAENFFRPSNNANVVAYENSIARPDADTGLKRLKILYRMRNGHIAELQVYHKNALPHLDASHKSYRRYRQAMERARELGISSSEALIDFDTNPAIVNSALKKARETARILEREIRRFAQARAKHNHAALAASKKLDRFETDENYFMLEDGILAVEVTRPQTGDSEVLIAHMSEEGVIQWKIEESVRPQLKTAHPISRQNFYRHAREMLGTAPKSPGHNPS